MIRRIAILFDNTDRPETTGFYCRRALGELVQDGRLEAVEHFLPSETDRIPADQFDLFLWIDDGHRPEIPNHLRPNAWWVIDTHLNLDWALTHARHFDAVFAAQKDGADALMASGIATAQWLPLACDPFIHGHQPTDKEFDFAFVGHVFPGERQRLIAKLQSKYPKHLVGNQYFHEMAMTYARSKVVFNRSLKDDLNMRVFEGLASGSLVITNRLPDNGQDELFKDGQHLVTYDSDDELIDKVDFYLRHSDERERIACSGQALVFEQHTYTHRMITLQTRINELQTSKNDPPASIPTAVQSKAADYFSHVRPEILNLVPPQTQRILDIGCGSGKLGEAIKARQAAHVTGIELNPNAAKSAAKRLDRLLTLNLELRTPEFDTASFDCVICADVLEHLREPERLLKRVREWLTTEGVLITSLPNMRHHSVVSSLLAGNWTYESAGLLDADHVRFFTRREIEKLLYRTGFNIQRQSSTPGPGYATWEEQGRPQQIEVGPLQVRCHSPEEAEEFFAYQWLDVCKPAPLCHHSLTSIIIATHNQLEYTRMCLDSIRLRIDEPFELIVVDNGSTDGTVEYLSTQPDVRLICNSDNRGFPAAVNQGLKVSQGENLLLLNNDVIVTTGWLRRQLDALHSEDSIGLVGPVSNNISGPQQISVSYSRLEELDGFAWDWGKRYHQVKTPVERLVGFCLVFTREVMNAIGLLDEQFGVGCFEDDDYCRRAMAAGYRCVIAGDAFVHHFGSRTFVGSGQDLGKILESNQKIYNEKWKPDLAPSSHSKTKTEEQATRRIGRPRFLARATDDGLRLVPNDIQLSACLIVRDNEQTIRPCLESLVPWMDEIIVVDTGSRDTTPQIAEELGARVFHWAWQDDFAAARNQSLLHARGEWIFWMDSDDTLPHECGRKLRELALGSHPDNMLGYVIQVHCPGGEYGSEVTAVDHVKLIRNRSDLNFEFRIHEQVIPSIRRANGDVGWTDLYVVHSGSDRTPQGQARKLERDFRLLHLEFQDRPDHPFVLFNLGMTHADCGQHTDAIGYLKRCIEVSEPEESHLRKAYALLVSSLQQSEQFHDAMRSCNAGLERFPRDKELLFRRAMLHHELGDLLQSARDYERVLSEEVDRHFTSVDQGLAGFKTRHNLAIVYEQLGRNDEAERQWRTINEEKPDYSPAWRGLGQLLLKRSDSESIDSFTAELGNRSDLEREAILFAAARFEAEDKPDDAIQTLENYLAHHPDDVDVLNELCRLQFTLGSPEHAVASLTRLAGLQPNDPAVCHNLGVAYYESGNIRQAEQTLEQSLRLRPAHQQTLEMLKHIRNRTNLT